MPLAEWDVPFLVTSPRGTLKLNEPQGGSGANKDDLYLLDESKCRAGISALRTTNHDKPQDDGAYLHRIFKSYSVITLEAELWVGAVGDAEPACDADRVRMLDNLMDHIDGLLDPAQALIDSGQTKIQWSPTGAAHDRMLNRVKTLTWPTEVITNPVMAVDFELHSPIPYAMDVNEQVSAIAPAITIVNGGTTAFHPVFRVHGPVGQFSIENIVPGLFINYDENLPGAVPIASGHYAEIATFGNTIFLDGSSTNLMAGLDVQTSDFWKLLRGSNDLAYTSDNVLSSCEMLWNVAWAV